VRERAAAQTQRMLASTTTDIALGGGLTLLNVLAGLLVVLFLRHALQGQPD
jgi:hypothetical protein